MSPRLLAATLMSLTLSLPGLARAQGDAKAPAAKAAPSDPTPPATQPAPTPAPTDAPEESKTAPAAGEGASGPPPRAGEAAAVGDAASTAGDADASEESVPSADGSASASASPQATASEPKDGKPGASTADTKPPKGKRGPAVLATMTVDEPAAPEEPPEPAGFGNYQKHVEFGVGFRANWIADEGYHQFSDKPFLPQVALGAGYCFFANDALSVAARLSWDYGGNSETLRGVPSRIELHRITLGPSLRYHLHRKLFAFATVAPGLRASQTVLDTGGVIFSARQFAFVMDLTLGAQVELIGPSRNDAAGARWWVGVEGGYSIGTVTDVVVEPGEGTPARTDPITLEPIELSGGIMRVTTSITF